MKYTVKSKYTNKMRIHYGKSDEPLFDHSIIEEYNAIERNNVEMIVASMIDVIPGTQEPKFETAEAQQIPEDVRNDITNDYKMRYEEFTKLMKQLNAGFFENSVHEFVYSFTEPTNSNTDDSKFVSSTISITKEM